ncbi:hypothetical protein JFN94_25975 [Burkholderia anthina]|uniref:Uncharacterized protein n=1 Tax=Burkholderia anthina TaxID=179879 RepID=A0A7T6VIV7_9BURK|nr:hypothetical protein [Burkholderia anthina]QQK04780.1 hypothetical protein JFN94_25975 [Burkholderia anthina]
MDSRNAMEYCADVPEGFREALYELRNPSRVVISLNPIPCAIAGISAQEWKAKIDAVERAVTA